MRLRERLGIGAARQRQLSRLLQVGLAVILAIGFVQRNLGIVVNAGVALAITSLPAVLRRDYSIPMDPGLTLWITTAVFLHALGTVDIPGTAESFYRSLPWWDSLTHTLSASVVAGVGYTTTRAVEEHTEAVRLPPRFMFVFILLFVLAFGVAWEVLEFALGGLAALLGSGSVLTQYGIADTMWDLVFDTVGGIVVAIWGTAHLTNVVEALATRLGREESGRREGPGH